MKKKELLKFYPEENYADDIEQALWEIKEEYDLPTEEIISVVQSKRKNLEYMHQILSKKEKYE